MFVDTHTHYYDQAYAGSEEAAIARAEESGVGKMIQADIDSAERDRMFEISGRHPGVLYTMLGLYPGSVTQDWRQEIEAMLPYRDRGIVAVGEIGLDYHESTAFKEEQKEALRVQLELAARWNLPVNIHLRDAAEDFFAILSECAHLGLRGNLHCFSGSYETFLRAQKYGDWSVGIGGVVTFKNASVAESVKKIPLGNILLETDCPYLAPAPHRGTRNESAYLPLIAAKIAELKGIDLAEVEAVTTANAAALFNI